MGIRTRQTHLQFARNDREIRTAEERRKRGLRRWVGLDRVYRPRQDPIVRFRRRKDFISRFHLTPECVLWLSETFAAHPACTTHGDIRGRGIPVLQKVCLALRHLASGATYGVVKDSQGGCSTSSVHRAVTQFVDFLVCTANRYIKFPKKSELPSVARRFQTKFEINDTVGLVDGTHIAINKPLRNEWAYYCRKKFHSLNVMVICDADGRLTAVESSFAGSQHDQFVWDMSVVGSKINHHNRIGSYCILGDSGYMLTPNVMTPYHHTSYSGLTQPEKDFHDKVVSVRSFVERTIGKWKGSWRLLSRFGAGVIKATPAGASRAILATACLHNIALDWDDPEVDADAGDPDYGDRIRRDAARARRKDTTTEVTPQHAANPPARPATTYATGALKRAEIIFRDFGGPNPAANANLARLRRRRRRRPDIVPVAQLP